jgi:hypothetical protein
VRCYFKIKGTLLSFENCKNSCNNQTHETHILKERTVKVGSKKILDIKNSLAESCMKLM